MLPAVDRKCSKDKTYRKKTQKKNKHKIKHKSHKKKIRYPSDSVQYSDVSSEELSSSEAGEIHSDFDDKHGALQFTSSSNKIITDQLRITRVTSPRNVFTACSPLSNQWELDSLPEDSSMSTHISVNNFLDMTTEVTSLKCKKSKKNSKKSKSPSLKRKKKKKDIKHKPDTLSDCDNSFVKCSNFTNLEVSNQNGDFNEPVEKYSIEDSHTPPLDKSVNINVSKVEIIYKDDEKHKHHRKEDKR